MNERDELSELLQEAVSAATARLATDTELLPFALAMQAEDGEIFQIDLEDEEASADHAVILAALRSGLRDSAREGRWRAVALVADVTLEDEEGEAVTSAIRVYLEHVGCEAVDCTLPYTLGEEEVEVEGLLTEAGEDAVFAPGVPPS